MPASQAVGAVSDTGLRHVVVLGAFGFYAVDQETGDCDGPHAAKFKARRIVDERNAEDAR